MILILDQNNANYLDSTYYLLKMKKTKHTIGRVERIDFPLWKMNDIEAKIDTGAYTSSIHCHDIEEFEKDGDKLVRFNLLDPEHPSYEDHIFELPIHDKRVVKSSNGQSSLRYFIQTVVRIFEEEFKIELSLTDRSEMRFPILIGRKFLKKRFIVDVAKKNLSLKSRGS